MAAESIYPAVIPPPATPTPTSAANNNPTSYNTCVVRTQNEQTTFINDKSTNRKDSLSGSIRVSTTQAALDVKLSLLNRSISPIERSLSLFPHGFSAATNIHQENFNVFDDHWIPYANTPVNFNHAAELIARVRTINATFECRKTIILQVKQ